MTRRDYVLLAASFNAAFKGLDVSLETYGTLYRGLRIGRDVLADALASDNPRFDRDRFIAACHE